MRAISAPLSAVLCALIAGCGGGGGGDLTGEVEVPDGYTQFRGAGVSFVHPQGWLVTERESADGAPSVQVTAPDETDTPGPLIQLIVVPEAGDRFDSLLDQERIVIEEVNDGKIQSQEEVEIEGATRALRSATTTPATDGTDPVEVKSAGVDLVRNDGDVFGFSAAAPQRGEPQLDPEAVIDSFRLVDG